MQWSIVWILVFGSWIFAGATPAVAAYPTLTFRHEHHLFELDPDNYTDWFAKQEVWFYGDQELSLIHI